MDLAARYAGQGSPAYDVENARLVVLLGEEGLGAAGQAMRLWQAACVRKGTQSERRLRLVCVSPRRPEARVDEWIPILPGGYGAFALSLAHVLLRDGLIDKEFVEAHVTDRLAGRVQGLPEFQEKRFERSGLKWVQAEFAPSKTEAATGVAPATVERLARALHQQAPALVMGTAGVAGASNGLASAMAVILVNALLGNVGREGGMLWQQRPALAAWSDESPDEVAAQGLQHPRIDGAGSEACPLGDHRVQALPEAILQDKPHPVEILLVRKTDPLTTLPGQKGWFAALHKIPFLVSFSSRLDRTTMLADLVLPEHTALEAWDVVDLAPGTGEPMLGMCQPVVAPVHDTRAAGALVIELADKVGGAVRKAVPWSSYEEAVKERLQGLAQAENNEYVATLMASMKDKGGWWREQDDERPLTAPGEIGLASLAVFTRIQKRPGAGEGQAERQFTAWPVEGMPPWEPARYAGASKDLPFLLYVYRPASLINEGMESCPWLSEVPLVAGAPSGAVVQMHPDDALLANVDDGDHVTVESPAGKCAATVRVSSGIRSGVLAMALGVSQGIDLLVVEEDRLSGLLAWQGTRVRMRASE
jgi:anaerobic selenocysteine-containing dehydrogenase